MKNSVSPPYPEMPAANGAPAKLVVFLHGLGSDGHDLIGLVPFMKDELPDCHFISPQGIEAYDMAPFGRQWFSVADRDPDKVASLIGVSAPKLMAIIAAKQAELKLTNKDTILIGFSQGTMMALYLNFIQDEPFYCVIGFSGRLIAPPECLNKTTPICLIHGEDDDVLPISELEPTVKYLLSHKIKHATLQIPHLRHSIDGRGIKYAIDFIKNISSGE